MDNLGSWINKGNPLDYYSETWISKTTDSSKSLYRSSSCIKGLGNDQGDSLWRSIVEPSHTKGTSSYDYWIQASSRHSLIKRLEEGIIYYSRRIHIKEVQAYFFKIVFKGKNTIEEDRVINTLLFYIGEYSSSIIEGQYLVDAVGLNCSCVIIESMEA